MFVGFMYFSCSWLLEATHPNTAGHTPFHSPFELAFIQQGDRCPGCPNTVPINTAAYRAVLANTFTKMVLELMVKLSDMVMQIKAWAGMANGVKAKADKCMANADQVRCSTTGRHMKLAGLGVVS